MATNRPDHDSVQAMYIQALRQNWGPLIEIVGGLIEEINQAGTEWYRQLETRVREFESLLATDELDEPSPDEILQAVLQENPSLKPELLARRTAKALLEGAAEGDRLNQLEEQAQEAALQALRACLAAVKDQAWKAVAVAFQEARRQMWSNLLVSAMALPLEPASSDAPKSLPEVMKDKMSDVAWRQTIEGKLKQIRDEATRAIQQAFEEGKESLQKEMEQQTQRLQDTYADLASRLYNFIRQALKALEADPNTPSDN
jgi:ElaB/YqjD/DUF883 family membrane-anchored ribosome-binding protein